jgi:hypothetical protein
MRDRHLPRLCRAATHRWPAGRTRAGGAARNGRPKKRPRTPLHVIPGGAPTDAVGRARAVNEARLAMDRWVDEGGRVPFEAAAVLRATRAKP